MKTTKRLIILALCGFASVTAFGQYDERELGVFNHFSAGRHALSSSESWLIGWIMRLNTEYDNLIKAGRLNDKSRCYVYPMKAYKRRRLE